MVIQVSNYIGPVVKVRDWRTTVQYSNRDTIPRSGGLPDLIQYNTNYLSLVLPDTAQTYKVKGWEDLVKQQLQAGSPYDRNVGWIVVTPGEARVSYLYSGVSPKRPAMSEFWGCNSLNYPSAVEMEGYLKANNQALVRFYSAIRAEYQHAKTLISIGELPETVRMFKRPFAGLQGVINGYLHTFDRRGKSIVHARKSRRKRNKRPLWEDLNRVAAESWLEASFGIRPLISDVVGIAETLSRFQDNGRDRRVMVQGYGESTANGSISRTSGVSIASHITGIQTSRDVTVWKVKYRAGINSQTSGPDGSLYRLRSLAGFTPEEFVPTVWNLCPWSFLADYFFNIGQVLDATWTVTSDVRWAIKSDLGKTNRDLDLMVDHLGIKNALGVNYISSSGSYAWRQKSGRIRNTRTILDPGNLPLPIIDSKRFEDWNPFKVANVLALLKTKARGISGALLSTSRG